MSLKLLENEYSKLGKTASLKLPLAGIALGGLAGAAYGKSDKKNYGNNWLHPAVANYGLIGASAGLGGSLAYGLKKSMKMDKRLAALAGILGVGGGALGAINYLTKDGPVTYDAPVDPKTRLKSLSEEAKLL
jgi:hypothetical protein